MEWFLKLVPEVQATLIGVAGLVVIVLLVQVRLLLERPATFSYTETTDKKHPDWWDEYAKSLAQINDGFHMLHYTIETKPKTDPDPKLKVTRYMIRRDDGLFWDCIGEQWVPKDKATFTTGDDGKKMYQRFASNLLDKGHRVRILNEEVEG